LALLALYDDPASLGADSNLGRGTGMLDGESLKAGWARPLFGVPLKVPVEDMVEGGFS